MTRRYEGNFYAPNGELLIADPKSAKAKYGHQTPEYMDSNDMDFLREGIAYLGPRLGYSIIFQLTKPSPGIPMLNADPVGKDFIVVEEKMPWSDGWHECSLHLSRVTWKD